MAIFKKKKGAFYFYLSRDNEGYEDSFKVLLATGGNHVYTSRPKFQSLGEKIIECDIKILVPLLILWDGVANALALAF